MRVNVHSGKCGNAAVLSMAAGLVLVMVFASSGKAEPGGAKHSLAAVSDVWAAIENPAGLGITRNPGVLLMFDRDMELWDTCNRDYGAIVGLGRLGAAGLLFEDSFDDKRNERAQARWFIYSLGFELKKDFFWGFSLNWFRPSYSWADPYTGLDTGFSYRPFNRIALGAVVRNLNSPSGLNPELSFGAACKPIGNSLMLYQENERTDYAKWRMKFGWEWELLPGIRLIGSILKETDNPDKVIEAGIGVNHAHGRFDYFSRGILDRRKTDETYSLYITTEKQPSLFRGKDKIAYLKIGGKIVDLKEPSIFSGRSETSLKDILLYLEEIKEADDLPGIFLHISSLDIGMGMLQELAGKIGEVRSQGKPVVAYMEEGGLNEYILACSADYIFVSPSMDLRLLGLLSEVTFFYDTFEKFGVKAEFERSGTRKSATEIFTQDSLSQEFREEIESIHESYFSWILKQISDARFIQPDTLKKIIDSGYLGAREAKTIGLVDELGYVDDALNKAGNLSCIGENVTPDRIYYPGKRKIWGTDWRKPESAVAVVFLDGVIMTGSGGFNLFTGANVVGTETVGKFLEEIRNDESVKAVVMRINSPGGSAVAADIINNEITKLQDAGKPVVASIGDVAASGGYYIACAADKIVANQGSIVGSIGVYSGKFVLKDLYNKLGITKDQVKTGENADFFSNYSNFNEKQRNMLKKANEEVYENFIRKVAQGRSLEVEAVSQLADGRIFTGEKAVSLTLADELGGLDRALETACILARLYGKISIQYYPRDVRLFDRIALEKKETRSELAAVYLLKGVKEFMKPENFNLFYPWIIH